MDLVLEAPEPPRRLAWLDSPELRKRLYWTLMGVALIAGLVGAVAEGPTRRLMTLLLLLCFLGAVVLVSRYPVIDRVRVDGLEAIHTPLERLVNLLNLVLVLIYNASILIVGMAVVVRAGWLPLEVDGDLVAWAPLAFAGYHIVMATAAKIRAEAHGIKQGTWYTRVAAWILAITGSLATVIGVVLVFTPTWTIGSLVLSEADLLGLILFVWVAAATQLFFLTGLPTLYDLVMKLFEKDEGPSGEMPPIVYAAATALGATIAIGFLASRFGLFRSLGSSLSSSQGAYVLILLPVGMAVFAIYTVASRYREDRQGLYKKRIPTKLRNDILVFGLSGIAGLVLSIITFRVIQGSQATILFWDTNVDTAKDLIMLTILVTMGPIGTYMNRQARRIDHIETRLADFLNDLAETRRAGLTLAASLHTSAMSDYGALSKEVEKMSNQVAWGVPFTEALSQFAARVPSSLVERSTSLIIEAAKTGGSVAEILKAAANDAREIKSLEGERKVTLSTYLVIIYVTFFVFMVVIGVLDAQFIPQVDAAQEAIRNAQAEGGGTLGGFSDIIGSEALDREGLRFTYFNAAVVQGIGNGIVAGLLMDQRLTSGFRHVAIMVFMGWVVFRWLLAF